MTRLRASTIALTMLVAFAVTFGILWRNRGDEPLAVPTPPGGGAGHASTPSTPSPQTARQAVLVHPPLDSTPASQRTASAEPSVAAADETPADEMPVELHFRHRPDLNKVQASLANSSENALVVDALVFDPRTNQSAKIQLDVAPYKAATFGIDDGLDIQSGDQITLRSTPYRDKVVAIP